MRKRWIVGTLVVLSLALASRAASRALAQKNAPPIGKPLLQGDAREGTQKKWRSPNDPQIKTTESALPDLTPPPLQEPPAASQEPPPANPGRAVEPAVGGDPMVAVDSFLHRNRKEADDSIKALNQEAEELRARLQKVEAALARWKAVANALSQDASQAPAKAESPSLEPIPQPGEGPIIAPPDPKVVPAPTPIITESPESLPILPPDHKSPPKNELPPPTKSPETF